MDLSDLTRLDTRHFVYSANRAGCTRLITCLARIDKGRAFKQFKVADLVDPDMPDEYALRDAGSTPGPSNLNQKSNFEDFDNSWR